MSKWQVQNWSGETLEVEADSMAYYQGSLVFSRIGHETFALAEGSWMTAHDGTVVIRTLMAPPVLLDARPLAPVVELKSKSKEQG